MNCRLGRPPSLRKGGTRWSFVQARPVSSGRGLGGAVRGPAAVLPPPRSVKSAPGENEPSLCWERCCASECSACDASPGPACSPMPSFDIARHRNHVCGTGGGRFLGNSLSLRRCGSTYVVECLGVACSRRTRRSCTRRRRVGQCCHRLRAGDRPELVQHRFRRRGHRDRGRRRD